MKTRVHLAKIPESSCGEWRPFRERFVRETRQFFFTSSLAGWQRRMRAFRLPKIVFQSLSRAEKTPPVLCSSLDEEKSPSSDQTETASCLMSFSRQFSVISSTSWSVSALNHIGVGGFPRGNVKDLRHLPQKGHSLTVLARNPPICTRLCGFEDA